MILITLKYNAQYHIDNNQEALRTANLHGWRVKKEEVRQAAELGSAVLQTFWLVPIRGGHVEACPTNLIIAIATVAACQWGEISALETRVGQA